MTNSQATGARPIKIILHGPIFCQSAALMMRDVQQQHVPEVPPYARSPSIYRPERGFELSLPAPRKINDP